VSTSAPTYYASAQGVPLRRRFQPYYKIKLAQKMGEYKRSNLLCLSSRYSTQVGSNLITKLDSPKKLGEYKRSNLLCLSSRYSTQVGSNLITKLNLPKNLGEDKCSGLFCFFEPYRTPLRLVPTMNENIRLDRKILAGTNALAYSDGASTTMRKILTDIDTWGPTGFQSMTSSVGPNQSRSSRSADSAESDP
jgi:ribosomal protein L32